MARQRMRWSIPRTALAPARDPSGARDRPGARCGRAYFFFAGKKPNRAIPMAPPTIAASARLKAGQ